MESLEKYGPPVQVARVAKTFQLVDLDGDGSISPEEFEEVLLKLNPETFRGKSLDLLFKAADADHNGRLDLEEFLNFVMVGDKRGVYCGESETDDSSSSSSSEDEGRPLTPTLEEPPLSPAMGAERPAPVRRPEHMSRIRSRSMKHEEPPTTADEMYELLTMREGVIGGKLRLDDFISLLAECKRDGLGPLIAELVLQECETPVDSDSKFEVVDAVYLYMLLRENPDVSVKDAKDRLATVDKHLYGEDLRKHEARHKFIRDQHLELDDPIGFGLFDRLLELLGAIMGVDHAHMLAALAWTRTCRFEMTESMAISVMEKVFEKVGSRGSHVLQQPIEQTDFARMCKAMELVDPKEKKGIAYPGSVFNKIIKHFPRHLLKRKKIRYYDRGMLETKPRKRKHNHKRILGRTQLSILIEELFKAIPKGFAQFGSPLNLTLVLLSKAADLLEDGAGHGRRRFKYA